MGNFFFFSHFPFHFSLWYILILFIKSKEIRDNVIIQMAKKYFPVAFGPATVHVWIKTPVVPHCNNHQKYKFSDRGHALVPKYPFLSTIPPILHQWHLGTCEGCWIKKEKKTCYTGYKYFWILIFLGIIWILSKCNKQI